MLLSVTYTRLLWCCAIFLYFFSNSDQLGAVLKSPK